MSGRKLLYPTTYAKKYCIGIYLGSFDCLRLTEWKYTLANVLTLRGVWSCGFSVDEWEFWGLYIYDGTARFFIALFSQWCSLSILGLPSLRHACPKCHSENVLGMWHSFLSQFFLFLLPDHHPYIVKNVCSYTHIWLHRDYIWITVATK